MGQRFFPQVGGHRFIHAQHDQLEVTRVLQEGLMQR